MRFYLPLVPDDPEQPLWSIIRKLSDKIGEGVTTHMRAIARLDLRIEGQTVWLTQLESAELFQTTTRQNVSLQAKNIFEDGELAEVSVIKESLTTAADGKRYQTRLYSLESGHDSADQAHTVQALIPISHA